MAAVPVPVLVLVAVAPLCFQRGANMAVMLGRQPSRGLIAKLTVAAVLLQHTKKNLFAGVHIQLQFTLLSLLRSTSLAAFHHFYAKHPKMPGGGTHVNLLHVSIWRKNDAHYAPGL